MQVSQRSSEWLGSLSAVPYTDHYGHVRMYVWPQKQTSHLRAILALTRIPWLSCLRAPSAVALSPALAHGSQSYLVMQSCGARGRQGLGHALLQGESVSCVGGGRARGLPGARSILGSAGCILASLQILLPRIHLRSRCPGKERCQGSSAHTRMYM